MMIQSIGRNIGKWLLGAGIAVAVACEEKSVSPAAPVIESVSAEADIHSATISFHVSGGLKGVRESGVCFGLDELDVAHDKDDRETRVQGGEDPSRHDYIIIELQNLEPSTRYYYQVFIGNGRSRVESDIFTFTTRPAGVEPPVPTPEWLEMDNTALLEALIARYDRNLDGGFYRRVLLPVSEASYGMYLGHMAVLVLFAGWISDGIGDSLGFWSAPAIILSTALSTFLSAALLAVTIRRIPVIGKWIVG